MLSLDHLSMTHQNTASVLFLSGGREGGQYTSLIFISCSTPVVIPSKPKAMKTVILQKLYT